MSALLATAQGMRRQLATVTTDVARTVQIKENIFTQSEVATVWYISCSVIARLWNRYQETGELTIPEQGGHRITTPRPEKSSVYSYWHWNWLGFLCPLKLSKIVFMEMIWMPEDLHALSFQGNIGQPLLLTVCVIHRQESFTTLTGYRGLPDLNPEDHVLGHAFS